MKKIVLSILIFIIFLTFLFSGCSIIVPSSEILNANIMITNWEQKYYEYSGELRSCIYIYYKIENTGNVDIYYYKIWFIANFIDGTNCGLLKIGQNVDISQYYSDYIIMYVPNKKVISIEILKFEL